MMSSSAPTCAGTPSFFPTRVPKPTNLESLTLHPFRQGVGGRFPVTDAGLEHLRSLTNLKKLHLFFSEITDAGVLHLEGLTKLQDLRILHARVTDSGLETLKQALPNCKIRHIPRPLTE